MGKIFQDFENIALSQSICRKTNLQTMKEPLRYLMGSILWI